MLIGVTRNEAGELEPTFKGSKKELQEFADYCAQKNYNTQTPVRNDKPDFYNQAATKRMLQEEIDNIDIDYSELGF